MVGGEESVSYYCRDIDRQIDGLAPLSGEEVNRLVEMAREGDLDARNKLIEHNLRFVLMIAPKNLGKGTPLADIISGGNFGFFKAIQKYDKSKGTSFLTYARLWVIQSMSRTIWHDKPIRVPYSKRHLAKQVLSLDYLAPSNDAEVSETSLHDEISYHDSSEENTLRGASLDSLKKDLGKLLNDGILTKQESEVLKYRFGLEGYEPKTLRDLGFVFGISRESIRKIQVKALQKLKEAPQAQRLRDYF